MNRPTRYEITATNGAHTFLVGYTPRLSRPGLLVAMQKHGEQLIALCGIGDQHEIAFRCHPRIHAHVNGWTIGFTGRTQRECQPHEHPVLRDLVSA